MLSITKDFTFDAAHRLVKGYKGKCSHLHGHSYHAFITVSMYEKTENFKGGMNPVEQDQYGFVVDFDEVKKVKQWVDENWDHAMLVSYDDEKMIRFLTDNAQKHYALKGNPTVENMCIELMAKASNLLNTERVFVSKVVIYETPTSCATLEGN